MPPVHPRHHQPGWLSRQLGLGSTTQDSGQPQPVPTALPRLGGSAGLPHPAALDGAARQRCCLGCTALVPAVTAWPGPRESHRGPARAGPTAGRLAGHPGGDRAPAVPQERSVPTSGLFTLFLVPARSWDEASRHLHRHRHLCTSALPSSQFGPCSCQAGSAQVTGAQSCSKYAGGVPQGQTQSPVFAGDLSALRGAQGHPRELQRVQGAPALVPARGQVSHAHPFPWQSPTVPLLPAAHFPRRCSPELQPCSTVPPRDGALGWGCPGKQHIITLGAGIREIRPKMGNQPTPTIIVVWFKHHWLCTPHCIIPAGAAPHGSCSEPSCALGASLGSRDNPVQTLQLHAGPHSLLLQTGHLVPHPFSACGSRVW